MKEFKRKWLLCYIILIWNTTLVMKNVAINVKGTRILLEFVTNRPKKLIVDSNSKIAEKDYALTFYKS